MRMSPHVGGSVYTPKRTVDSNRRGFAEQRTRLSPVSNRVDQSDGPDGRVPPPLTMTWVEEISTSSSALESHPALASVEANSFEEKGPFQAKSSMLESSSAIKTWFIRIFPVVFRRRAFGVTKEASVEFWGSYYIDHFCCDPNS